MDYLLSHTLTDQRDIIGIINRCDFDFLLRMVDGFHLHLSYEVDVSISHQGTDIWVGFFFIDPYITWLVLGMGILEGTQRMRIVGDATLMTLETL